MLPRTLLLAAFVIATAPALAGDDPRLRNLRSGDAYTACDIDAGNMEGDQRRAYVERCMAHRERPSARSRRCAEEARGVRREERAAWLDACLRAGKR